MAKSTSDSRFSAIFAVIYIESLFDLLPDQPPISASPPVGAVLLALALLAVLALRLGVSLRSESNFMRLTLSMGAIGITFTILSVFAPRVLDHHIGWIDRFNTRGRRRDFRSACSAAALSPQDLGSVDSR